MNERASTQDTFEFFSRLDRVAVPYTLVQTAELESIHRKGVEASSKGVGKLKVGNFTLLFFFALPLFLSAFPFVSITSIIEICLRISVVKYM